MLKITYNFVISYIGFAKKSENIHHIFSYIGCVLMESCFEALRGTS